MKSQTLICRACHEPIVRDWTPTDPTLAVHHAGCRPNAGRLPRPAAPLDRTCPACAAQPGTPCWAPATHPARFNRPPLTPAVRKCAAWIGCGNLAVPVADLSFRGFCPACEAVATGQA